MKKVLTSLLILNATLLATPPTYVNMSYSQLTHSNNGTVSDFDPTAFKWTIGQVIKEYNTFNLALEGTAMLGVQHEKKTSVASSTVGTFTNASIALDTLYNINLKATLPILDTFSFATYLGVSRGKMELTATNNTPNNAYKNAITYGAGLEYNIIPSISIHLDYMQYFRNLHALELGLGFRF